MNDPALTYEGGPLSTFQDRQKDQDINTVYKEDKARGVRKQITSKKPIEPEVPNGNVKVHSRQEIAHRVRLEKYQDRAENFIPASRKSANAERILALLTHPEFQSCEEITQGLRSYFKVACSKSLVPCFFYDCVNKPTAGRIKNYIEQTTRGTTYVYRLTDEAVDISPGSLLMLRNASPDSSKPTTAELSVQPTVENTQSIEEKGAVVNPLPRVETGRGPEDTGIVLNVKVTIPMLEKLGSFFNFLLETYMDHSINGKKPAK